MEQNSHRSVSGSERPVSLEQVSRVFALLRIGTLVVLSLFLFVRRLPAFLLTSTIAAYYITRILRRKPTRPEPPMNASIVLGKLGPYPAEDGYGLYIRLQERIVFVDIREDDCLKERELYAAMLQEGSVELSRNLAAFQKSNPEFGVRTVNSIGIHSHEHQRGEVFWSPSGYTLLKGLQFLPDSKVTTG
jgi:hypothetical protein